MEPLTRAMTGAMRVGVRLMPAGRRDFAEAVLAEADDVPAGRLRRSWLFGGLRLVLREAPALRRAGVLVAATGVGTFVVWLDWHAGSANPAVPTNRVATIIAVGLLAILPMAVNAVLGPVADNRVARIVRTGGYVAVYALLSVMAGLSRFASSRFDHFQAFDQRAWEADMRTGGIVGAVLLIAMTTAYAVAILCLTARRTSLAPRTLAVGAITGVAVAVSGYALMPLGNPLHPTNGPLVLGYGALLVVVLLGAPLAAGVLAGSAEPEGRTRGLLYRVGQGGLAGLCTGGIAAALIVVLTFATMLLLPGQVDLRWANPDPTVAHGTPFEVRMSVGDAAIKYQLGLFLGPLLGFVLGALAAATVLRDAVHRGIDHRGIDHRGTVHRGAVHSGAAEVRGGSHPVG